MTSNSESTVRDIELVDIEDIVPSGGGNSLFLCVARVLIYMSYKNATFSNALNVCCGISRADMKSDVHLQAHLRKMVCEYWCEHGVVYDRNKNVIYLRSDYSRLASFFFLYILNIVLCRSKSVKRVGFSL